MPKVLPPNLKETLLNAMNVAETSIEAAEYLATRFKETLIQTKSLGKFANILEKVEEFVKYTTFKLRSSTEPWLGQTSDSSDYKNMQTEMALDALKQLETVEVGITESAIFEFALNNKSELLRGYAAEGKSLDSKSLASMDTLFNAFLAQNNIVSQGSKLYKADENGTIKKENGVEVTADPQKVRDLINDPDKGYAKYLELKGIQITCQEHTYPSAQKDVQVQQGVEESINTETRDIEESSVETQSSTMRT